MKRRRIRLGRETIRVLEQRNVRAVIGGVPPTMGNTCQVTACLPSCFPPCPDCSGPDLK